MGTIQRGKVQRGDLANWDGNTSAVTRVDATGGTITGLAVGNEVDVLQVYGSGTARTLGTMSAAVQKISGNVTLVFAPGTWDVTDDITIPSNFTCHVPAGCIFDITTGKTLTFSGLVRTDLPSSWTSGAGTVVVSNEGSHFGVWHQTAAEVTASVTPTDYTYPPGNVLRYGTNTTPGTTDMTVAFQAASDSNTEVSIPDEQVRISSTITQTVNRQVIKGLGIKSEIVFRPTVNDDILFTGTNLDNLVFRAFTINGNAGSATGKIGLSFDSTTTRILVDEVYFTTLDKYCILRASLQYDQYINCRFLNTGNGTDDNGIAIVVTTFANRLKIDGCRFGNNDRDINIVGGKAVSITDSSFEATGSLMGNVANWDSSIELTDCEGFTIDTNYFEAVRTLTTTGVVHLKTSSATTYGSINNNIFSADLAATSYSKNMIYASSAAASVSVGHNVMKDGTNAMNAFIVGGSRKITAHSNYYEESGSELTTYAGVIARMSSATKIELDIPFTFTYDPGNLVDGAGETSQQTMTGVVLGDFLMVSAPYDLQDISVTAYVQAANTVEVRVQNESTNTVDLGSGTWKVRRIVSE